MTAMYIVPTRGRPANAVRLANAWNELTSQDTQLTFIVDEDDPEFKAYEDAFFGVQHANFGFITDKRLRLGGTLNKWGSRFAQHFEAIGFMGDDHLPRTHHWDQALLNSLSTQGGGIVYGNDLLQGRNLPTAVLMDSTIIKALGYMVPPGLTHLYVDNFWRDLGTSLGQLAYREDVIIEHLHPVAGKAEWDDRYKEVNAGQMYENDRHTYEDLYVRGGSLVEAVKTIRRYEDSARSAT
jgi:hypothetical protein